MELFSLKEQSLEKGRNDFSQITFRYILESPDFGLSSGTGNVGGKKQERQALVQIPGINLRCKMDYAFFVVSGVATYPPADIVIKLSGWL